MNLSKNVKVVQALGYYGVGTTKRTSSIIDMAGYDGVMFIVGLGAIIEAGTLDAYCEQDALNATTYMSRIPASTTALTITAAQAALTKSCIIIDLFQPEQQYIQCNITPAAQQAVILGIVAILYKGKVAPPTADASVLASNFYQSPAEV